MLLGKWPRVSGVSMLGVCFPSGGCVFPPGAFALQKGCSAKGSFPSGGFCSAKGFCKRGCLLLNFRWLGGVVY
jgi:hypothetical protein